MKFSRPIVNGERVPGTFSGAVVLRMFKDNELQDFFASYQGARLRNRMRPPTAEQRKIADYVRSNGVSYKTAAAKFKVKEPHQIANAVKRAAIWDFLNK